MKKFRYTKLLGWLAAATLLLTTSCKDDMLFGNGSSDEVTVTFTLTPEAAAPLNTRAHQGNNDEDANVWYPDEGEYPTISDGSKADMLIYSLYEEKEDGTYELLEGYSDGSEYPDIECGDGQTIMKIDEFPVTVTLTLKRGAKYAIAFWAQNHECKLYDTNDLRKVEVIYGEIDKDSTDDTHTATQQDGEDTAGNGSKYDDEEIEEGTATFKTSTPNNDESRDAFCKSVIFTAGESGLAQNVLLYRPLAQINVGTSGFDFETITRNADKKYTYSKIRLNRVARYLNVVEDKTYSSTTDGDESFGHNKTPEAFAVVDFGYAPIPAYVNRPVLKSSFNEIQDGSYDVPKYPSYTIWDWDYDGYTTETDKDGNITKINYNYDAHFPHTDENITRLNYTGEEFLKVHMYERAKDEEGNVIKDKEGNVTLVGTDSKYKYNTEEKDGYLAYSNLKNHNEELSETFKYLSMCYVLTSSTHDEAITINNVKVWVATDANGKDEIEVVNLNNVPAQRNWRTNIVGNILTESTDLQVKLDRDFAGEYNAWNAAKDNWSGPLAKGVYYDAKNDEIQISDVDGLIWFQKMVNGTMTVREALLDSHLDKPYKYFDSNGIARNFTYNGIEYDENNSELMERILVATHQKYNKNYKSDVNHGWPAGNNFHFTGVKTVEKDDGTTEEIEYPAKVKLMADIDLYGIEWIPIGFECRMLETMYDSFGETEKVGDPGQYSTLQDKVKVTQKTPTYRGFFGIFDGNNHTISNMTTKRFSAKVHDNAVQGKGTLQNNGATGTRDMKPTDNPQWFGRGLFGQIGGNAKIRNVRLLNVDIYGCNGVAGIAGIAYGDNIEITNCVVDGGSIIATPMYRGDAKAEVENNEIKQKNDRTFARGVYLGGIVGYFKTDGGRVDNCEVKNLYLQGYRRAGGLIGSIAQNHLGDDEDTNLKDEIVKKAETYPSSISNNKISNTILVASQYSTFGMPKYDTSDQGYTNTNGTVIRSGFGWNAATYRLYSNKFVGGYTQDYDQRPDFKTKKVVTTGNVESNLTFSEFTIYTNADDGYTIRHSQMQAAPLRHMPMLSSWYADNIVLNANYYGEPSAYTRTRLHLFNIWSSQPRKSGYQFTGNEFTEFSNGYYTNGGNTFAFPIQLPEKVDIDWDMNSPRAGLYVESVTLDGDGDGSIGGRSVVTPTGVEGDGACVMYVTARNRHQFSSANDNKISYKKPTIIKNMVLRGQPYANAGILVASNKNMNELRLENVAIYDVYKTIAMDDWNEITEWNVWPNNAKYDAGQSPVIFPALNVTDCNLRGYTVPGGKWSTLTYTRTTFEKGTNTDKNKGAEGWTYKAETAQDKNLKNSETVFNNCFFKAPYIIDLSEAYTADGKNTVTFNNCYATAASTANMLISPEEGVKRIIIGKNAQGDPIVEYLKDDPTTQSAKKR